jgi:hypothetical protein
MEIEGSASAKRGENLQAVRSGVTRGPIAGVRPGGLPLSHRAQYRPGGGAVTHGDPYCAVGVVAHV